MKLADILAIKKKLRCPACQSKLDWQKKRLLVATGRCPCCATQIIEDLPPANASATLLDFALFVENQSFAYRYRGWLWLAGLLLAWMAAIGVAWGLWAWLDLDSDAAGTLLLVVILVATVPFIYWMNKREQSQPKCLSCGKLLDRALTVMTGRCGHCGAVVLDEAKRPGVAIVKPVEFLRQCLRNDVVVNVFGYLMALPALVILVHYLLKSHLNGVLLGSIVLFLVLVFSQLLGQGLPRFSSCCPDCQTIYSVSFSGNCPGCGRRLVDFGTADIKVPARQFFRRQAMIKPAVITFWVLAFWVGPWDCGRINDADLLPPPRPSITAENNAWTYFAKAFQVLPDETDHYESMDDLLSGKAWDEKLATTYLSAFDQALPEIDKGLACSACQWPALTSFLEYGNKSRYAEMRRAKWLSQFFVLRMVYEQRQERFDDAVNTGLKELNFALKLQEQPEDLICFLTTIGISKSSLPQFQELARNPKAPESALIKAERGLRRFADEKLWNPGCELAMKREYALDRDLICHLRDDPAYMRIAFDGSDNGGLPYLISQANICYQPNRTLYGFADSLRLALQLHGNYSKEAGNQLYSQIEKNHYLEMGMHGQAGVIRNAPNLIGNIVFHLRSPHMGYSKAFAKKRYLVGEFQLTRALLLCLAYEKKHGQLPETLQALVPEFVEAVPLDPFDGQPVRYSKERQIVYCVGSDGKDDGAPQEKDGRYNRLRDQLLELKPKAKE